MAEKRTGLAPLPAGLLRPTTPHETIPAPEPEADGAEGPEGEGQGRGDGGGSEPKPSAPAARTRKKRPPVSDVTRGRKLILPDDVHDRLWLLARQRRTTVSAVAAEILDRNLPRWTVTKEG